MKIVMELKSDAIPGSGASIAGIIDRDIVYDDYGLPFIPAKRIKGILRESAEELRYSEKDLAKLFGVPGSKQGCAFRIDNGYIQGYEKYKKVLSTTYNKTNGEKISTLFPPQEVLDYFTYTRSQTTIENGVARENSLRVSRVLKKGLIFEFSVTYNPGHKKYIEPICKVTRAFGASRTRGFGEISLHLKENEQKGNSEKQNSDPASCQVSNSDSNIEKIRIVVQNTAPLLLSAKPGKDQISESYIPGSTVLGAVAAAYLRTGKKISKNNEAFQCFHDLFVSGRIRFGNLYPCTDDEIICCYPASLSVKKVKEIKEAHSEIRLNNYIDFALLDDEKNVDQAIFKGGLPEFVSRDHSNTISIRKQIESHHRRPSDRHIAKSTQVDGEFFQFEVIEADQCFAGDIVGDPSLLEILCNFLPKEGNFWLGKSKTGQYGKCTYKLKAQPFDSHEKFEWHSKEKEAFILLSDMILFNENGFATPDIEIFKKELAAQIGADSTCLELIDCYAKDTMTGGFLGVWGMPRIQQAALSTGTVVVIKNCGEEKLTTATPIAKMAFGARTEEGFGQIALYKNFDNDEYRMSAPRQADKEYHSLNDELEVLDDNEPVHQFLTYQVRKYARQKIRKKAAEKAQNALIISGNSFIGKLIKFLKDSEDESSFNKKISALTSGGQRQNLSKIEDSLFINNSKINNETFCSSIINQSQNDIPDSIKKEFGITEDFFLYKEYVLTFLAHIKFRNRTPDKGGDAS